MIDASVLIVSRNRRRELEKTLSIIVENINRKKHEVLVLLDNSTDDSVELKLKFPEVTWFTSDKHLGASRARNQLYKNARGYVMVGFDDDAHPLEHNFIEVAVSYFKELPKLGIICFREIRGAYPKDSINNMGKSSGEYYINDFTGCGFAVRRDVYLEKTRGFPKWIDIYGEEVCLSMEVLDAGYDILYTPKISVHHRIEKLERKKQGANYFRFGKQLKNTSYFYLVYYPFPLLIKKIGRLYYLNFVKYALKDKEYFITYFKSLFDNIIQLKNILDHRKPVSKSTLSKFNKLQTPPY